jgi:hypothetical protein
MQQRGQTTSFQVRLEMMEPGERGVERYANRHWLEACSLWTVRRVATKSTQAWPRRFNLTDGTSCYWVAEHLCRRIKRGHPSRAQTPSRLLTGHTFSRTQDGCLLV